MNVTQLKNSTLKVYVRSKKQTIFEGNAKSISSQNDGGFFDILPMHTNYVTLVKNFVLVDKGLSSEKHIKLDSGIITVVADTVKVFVGI